MKRVLSVATVALMLSATVAWACPNEGDAQVTKASAQKKYDCCPKALSGTVAGVLNEMPAMSYKVGDFETHCAKTAESQVAEGVKMHYLVAGKTYDSQVEALTVLTAALEKKAENMRTVQFEAGGKTFHCPVTAKAACKGDQKMKYQVAGVNFASREKAEEALEQIKLVMTTKSAKSKSGCGSACPLEAKKAGAVAASGKKGGCDKSKKAGAVAASGKKGGCDKSKKAETVAASATNKPCCDKSKKAGTVAASGKKSGCNKAKTAGTVVQASDSKSGCPIEKAQEQVAAVQAQIRTMVETAASVALSS